jgi:ankyrin repeat protein
MTTLLQAAKQGLEDVVQQHLSLPSLELNAKDDDGYTAVHYAAKFNHIQILKLLLKANADAELKTTRDNNLDNSPLHLACINGFVGVAKVLIAAKCNIEERCANE